MHTLDKKWKEFLFAANSFGPNLLFVLIGAYLTDAMNPIGLTANIGAWSVKGYCLVVPVMFGVTWALAKLFDGLVDIPLAHLTDNIRTRWGRRRPMFLAALIPLALSYFLVWTPLQARENSLVNTLWIGFTLLIPVFMIREGEKYGQGKDYLKEARVPFKESLRLTLSNRLFLRWLIPNACAYFGLNMFLAAQNTLISGVMNLDASYGAIMNTCAFAPVPLMLFIYYKLIRKKGLRFSYRLCLISFAVAILNFCVGSEYLFPNSAAPRIIIGCVGGVIGSFGIGAFFATPYMVPSQIAAMEFKTTGKDHTAMYFAVQAFTTAAVAAISTGLVYEQIKNIVSPKVIGGVVVAGETWKIGVSLVPALVCIMCIVGFFVARKMPASYTEEIVSEEMARIEGKKAA